MNLKEHIKADLLFLGYTDPSIHKMIDDLESLQKYGPYHRRIGHNFETVEFITMCFGESAFYISLLHILIDLDIFCSRKILKRYLNGMSKM